MLPTTLAAVGDQYVPLAALCNVPSSVPTHWLVTRSSVS